MSSNGRQLFGIVQLLLMVTTFVLIYAEGEIAEGGVPDSGLGEEVDKRGLHPLFGSHYLYKRLLRLPYQRRQAVSRFTHSFIGKRSPDEDSDHGEAEEVLDRLYPALAEEEGEEKEVENDREVGDEDEQEEEEEKRAPGFSHRFVGKRAPYYGHRFVGKRQPSYGHRFVGKRAPNGLVIRAPGFTHRFVGKRAPAFGHRFVGKRYGYGFQIRAPAFQHRFVGKRDPAEEDSDLEADAVLSADYDNGRYRRDAADTIALEARAPAFGHRFVGKRAGEGYRLICEPVATAEDGEASSSEEVDLTEKRAPSFGHRFVGKRDAVDAAADVEKRPRSYGHRFVGKRLLAAGNPVLGYRSLCRLVADDLPEADDNSEEPASLNLEADADKRAPAFGHRFVGKRVPADLKADKRAPSFGHRFVGKRIPEGFEERAPGYGHRFVGKRIPDGLDKRAPGYGHRFVGKRSEEGDSSPSKSQDGPAASLPPPAEVTSSSLPKV